MSIILIPHVKSDTKMILGFLGLCIIEVGLQVFI